MIESGTQRTPAHEEAACFTTLSNFYRDPLAEISPRHSRLETQGIEDLVAVIADHLIAGCDSRFSSG